MHEVRDDSSHARDRLSGWKEIAAFLGKSVRTSQRWEERLGLPVHRSGYGDTEIVWATREQINKWMDELPESSKRQTRSQEPDRQPDSSGVASPPAAVGLSRGRRAAPWAVAMVVLVVCGLGFWVWLDPLSPRGSRAGAQASSPRTTASTGPTDWRIESRAFVALGAERQVLWRYSVQDELLPSLYDRERASLPYRAAPTGVVLFDLDRDGASEVLLVTRWAGTSACRLVCLDHDGRVLWGYGVRRSVRFGKTTYYAPFSAVAIHVSHRSQGGPAIWVVSNHRTEFPSVLERLDIHGTPQSSYWSNGYINSVLPATVGGRDVVLVGASHNESGGGSLAVLDARSPNGSAPAVDVDKQCQDCPAGTPLEFLVFPRAPVFRGQGGTAPITQIVAGPQDVIVGTLQAYYEPHPAVAFFTLDERFGPLRASVDDFFKPTAKALQAIGTAGSLVEPVEAGLWPVLRWDAERRAYTEVRPPTF